MFVNAINKRIIAIIRSKTCNSQTKTKKPIKNNQRDNNAEIIRGIKLFFIVDFVN